MRKIETAAVVLVIVWLCSVAMPFLNTVWFGHILGARDFSGMSAAAQTGAAVQIIVASLVQIAVSVWIFILARRQGGNPWIWALFGLTYGLLAVVTFFLYCMHVARDSRDEKDQITSRPSTTTRPVDGAR
jgi:hypothetical protein